MTLFLLLSNAHSQFTVILTLLLIPRREGWPNDSGEQDTGELAQVDSGEPGSDVLRGKQDIVDP